MKRLVIGFTVGLLLFAGVAFANSTETITLAPNYILQKDDGFNIGFIWIVDGTTIVNIYEESFVFCSCENSDGCVEEFLTILELTPTPVVSEPTNTPEPTDMPEPTKTPKPKCDQGRGNGDDGCSPGNSDRNHDPNDPQKGPRK